LNVTGTITGDTSLTLDSTTISTAELAVLDSVTPGTAAASKALILDSSKNISTIGTIGCGAITSSGNLNVTGTITGDTSLTLDSTTVTTAELAVLDGVTPGTATASKALVLDSSKNISTIGSIGCGAITSSGNLAVTGTITGDTSLTLDSTTVSTAELGVLDGASSGTVVNSKAVIYGGAGEVKFTTLVPGTKTSIADLGTQTISAGTTCASVASDTNNPTATEVDNAIASQLAQTQAKLTAVQAKLDSLLDALQAYGLV